MGLNVWAGVVPIETRIGMPTLDPTSNPNTSLNQDFSRIAEILRPSEGANVPVAAAKIKYEVDRPEGGGVAEALQATSAPALTPRMAEPVAKTVTTAFTLADGSQQNVAATVGKTVMEAAVAAGVSGILAECGGSMACATCHVYVNPDWAHRVPPPSAGEESMLDFVGGGRRDGSRLTCQIKVTEDMDGFHVTVPEGQG